MIKLNLFWKCFQRCLLLAPRWQANWSKRRSFRWIHLRYKLSQ